jgi:hypothetical protein
MKPAKHKEASLSAQRLRELLHYEPKTGLFVWIYQHKKSARMLGKQAGSQDNMGYLQIKIDGLQHKSHRLAWLYVYGSWPDKQIDHINGDSQNNRIENLRQATASQNRANSKLNKDNKSRFKGAHLRVGNRKYQAMIKINGRSRHLGIFTSPEDAHAAYCAAASKLFGKFARSE